ncbi:MAG TPA: IPTL-CTERM sorting domain-containing protein [Terriglobia bacterium]|nr:IPTL-CTERM sorting domain-containing protein [Terriglobia bacterium]
MRRVLSFVVLSMLCTSMAFADVSIVERHATRKQMAKAGKGRHPRPGGATGSIALIDAQGMKYFINTNITFSTSSSASAAASEASYTHAVAASTSGGGTVSSTLNDSYDGYQTLCLVNDNTIDQPCETGNSNFTIYNKRGAPPTTECNGRQLVFPNQTAGNITMFRKVYVPTDDQFARWLNYFTNTGATPQTVTMETGNNLGSDSNTIIVSDSGGNTAPDTTSEWVTTFQNFSGNTTSDPRLGHVLGQAGAAVGLAAIFFQNGNDNPYWGYTFTLNPGETKIIMNFGVNQPTKALANSKSAALVLLPPTATECMSTADLEQTANFNANPPIPSVPALSPAGLAALGALLCAAAVVMVRRRRAADVKSA